MHIGYSDWPPSRGLRSLLAIDSTVAIYVLEELQVPLGLRSLKAARPLYPRSLYPMGTVLSLLAHQHPFSIHIYFEMLSSQC